MDAPVLPREIRLLFAHTTVVLFLLTVGFYLLPVRSSEGVEGYARLAVSLAALGLLVVVLRGQATRSRQSLSPGMRRVQGLLAALYVLVLGFALAYAAVAALLEGQVAGIHDRTDALYFSVSIVSTVGFGDIHAVGTVARLLVTVHMLFNLVYLGTAVRLLGAAGRSPG